MNRVYTTDYDETELDTFRPGEAVVLWLEAMNHTPETFTGVDYNWITYGPSGTPLGELSYDSWSVDMPPGQDDVWWISDGLPDDATLGAYTFTGTVSHDDASSAAGMTFTVAGSPISITMLDLLTCEGVESNFPVGVKDSFGSADAYVYAWSAWEGATRPATHVLDWGWYRPDGSSYYTYTHTFTPTVSVYYTWAWLDTQYLYDYGTYSVTLYLDGEYVGRQPFSFTAGSTAERPSRWSLPRWGAGGGGGEVPRRGR